jgi:hypothetical protein
MVTVLVPEKGAEVGFNVEVKVAGPAMEEALVEGVEVAVVVVVGGVVTVEPATTAAKDPRGVLVGEGVREVRDPAVGEAREQDEEKR